MCRGEAGPGWKRLTKQPDAQGFHHYRREDDDRHQRNGDHKAKQPAPRNWKPDAERFARLFTKARRQELAEWMGLPAAAFDAIPLIGYHPDDSNGPCYTFPETDATGRITGLMRRYRDGQKMMMAGGTRGLTVPLGWADRSGSLYAVEGASDTLVLTLAGLCAVGRPSNRGGVDYLAQLLRGWPADRPVLLVGENDKKPDGEWPGRDGAELTAKQLTDKLKRPFPITFPPDVYKDAREWARDLADGQGEGEDWPAIGAAIAAQLTARVETPAAKWPKPVPMSQLPERGPVVNWIHHGCIARGHITLYYALFKSGKTTYVSHLLRSLQTGGEFIGRAARQCRTLIVSEESESIWRMRRDALGLSDHLHVLSRPMLMKPSFADWVDFLQYIASIAIGNYDLVAIDTISAFAPWKSENDAAEVQATLTPLNMLTKAGLAVLLFHHVGKEDKSEGRAARGSTALAGAVDILLEMRRYKPEDSTDRRRVISGLGRFDEIPEEVVIALAPDGSGYTAEGDRKALAEKELRGAIAEVLPVTEPGLSADAIHSALPVDGRPRRGDVMKALRAGVDARLWTSAGSGKPRDPFRFWRPRV